MASGILAIIETSGGELKKAAFEVVSEAKRLAAAAGGPVTAGTVGTGIAGAVGAIGKYGAEKVLVADAPVFEHYRNEAYATAVVALVKAADPAIVLFGASATGKDLAPSVAAALGAPLFTDCTGLSIEDGKLQALRPVYAGKATITVGSGSTPVLASLRPNVFPAEETDGGDAPVETIDTGVAEDDLRVKVREIVAAEGRKVDLTEADIIVSGGRGMKGPEHFVLVEDLAESLGGVVGASRAVVDAGWRPHAQQVGQTGKTVSPKLYVACGISGAIQHLAGMSSSKCIVAVNKDPDAPIFKVADYGIVGDVFDVLPALTEEVRKRKA